MNFWEKVREIHFSPTEFYENVDGESFSEPSKFVLYIGLIFAGLISLLGLSATVFGDFNAISFGFISLMLVVIVPMVLIGSALFQSTLVHLAVYIFGKRGFSKTYNAVAYPVTAVFLWGWIPVLNIFASLYSIYLQTKGVQILHDMSFGKALIAVVWPIILSIVLTSLIIFVAVLSGFMLGLG